VSIGLGGVEVLSSEDDEREPLLPAPGTGLGSDSGRRVSGALVAFAITPSPLAHSPSESETAPSPRPIVRLRARSQLPPSLVINALVDGYGTRLS
jgi:hypothetical protein